MNAAEHPPADERTEVGLVGLGVMGSAIGRRLLDTGHRLTVHDVRTEAMDLFAAAGAATAATPRDLSRCDVVVLSLNTTALVEEVVFGARGVLAQNATDLLIIDMSSITPAGTRDLAARAHDRGASWVDAPLSGGSPAVARGELTLMLGGGTEDVARATPVLADLASRITHIGPAGAGQVVKLVNQVLVGCGFAAIAEAAALVRAADLPADRVVAALSGGRADSALLQEFFLKFAHLDLTPTGRVSNMVKDLETARDYAVSANVPLPVTTTVSELHRWLAAAGHGDADNATLMLYYVAAKQPGRGIS
jgi:3-hydroxyisobutyrate dehydrogenase-like beta-hydroxyacid dehydrogenase